MEGSEKKTAWYTTPVGNIIVTAIYIGAIFGGGLYLQHYGLFGIRFDRSLSIDIVFGAALGIVVVWGLIRAVKEEPEEDMGWYAQAGNIISVIFLIGASFSGGVYLNHYGLFGIHFYSRESFDIAFGAAATIAVALKLTTLIPRRIFLLILSFYLPLAYLLNGIHDCQEVRAIA